MAADKIHSGLFKANGCCSESALHRLASGELDAEQAPEAMAHLAECNLCREAEEGLEEYLLHNDMARFNAQVASINLQVAAKSGYKSGPGNTGGKKPGSGRFWFFFRLSHGAFRGVGTGDDQVFDGSRPGTSHAGSSVIPARIARSANQHCTKSRGT